MSLLQRLTPYLLAFLSSLVFCGAANCQTMRDMLASCNFNMFRIAPPANSFELDGADNMIVNPAAMKDKVIILNFWKIDCSACSMEKPLLEKLYRKYSDRGLEVVAVNLFDRPSDILAYAKKTDYPFTYAFDAHQRYTVNQKRLPSGVPTTFVVNSESEAIYETPGLPTTYVIDRNGRVVGYSVGLVNWDNGVMSSFIESLLGPPRATLAASHGDSFTSDAKQGAGIGFGPTRFGPRGPKAPEPESLTESSTPPIMGTPSSPETPPSLPFQSTSPAKSNRQAVSPAAQDKTQGQDHITVKTPNQPKEKSKPKSKQEKSANTKAAADHKPKPFSASTQKGAGSSDYPAYSTASGQTQAVAPGSAGTEATGKEKSLPPLPAAMPYSPPNRSSQQTPIRPDQSGSVVARIPGGASGTTIGRSGEMLPAAQPVIPRNNIGVSIMDSFSNARSNLTPAVAPVQEQQELVPPSTIFGQFSQDIQNLGAGIRDTFSSLMPKGQ